MAGFSGSGCRSAVEIRPPATPAERTPPNPMTLGSHTRVRGRAVMAVTDLERARDLPADMMPG
ncbi:hypothetical protein AB0B25_08480 [Nocardia sp. NPDC049190]|uniref:hypothetical protein n=1 Tax=Nocardia sp. NPDC049190 TaxID=3155650 RepID=UPI0033F7E0B1